MVTVQALVLRWALVVVPSELIRWFRRCFAACLVDGGTGRTGRMVRRTFDRSLGTNAFPFRVVTGTPTTVGMAQTARTLRKAGARFGAGLWFIR
uniref:Putative secreted protein n=1 Tax=Anopheles marajoara TaxID=58244 RepID=A0A2M4C9I4_9DIPT